MVHLLGLVLLIGIVDSFNPATIAPALYLAAGKEAHRGLFGFIVGGLAVNLGAGIFLALGPGQALLALLPKPDRDTKHWIELGAGIVTLLVAVILWLLRERIGEHVAGKADRVDRSSILVGAGLMLVELPTAVPYFAVIAAVVGSGRRLSVQIGLLGIFNLAFFAPLIVIMVIRALTNERGAAMLGRLRTTIDRRLATFVPLLVLLVSVLLLAVGIHGVTKDH